MMPSIIKFNFKLKRDVKDAYKYFSNEKKRNFPGNKQGAHDDSWLHQSTQD